MFRASTCFALALFAAGCSEPSKPAEPDPVPARAAAAAAPPAPAAPANPFPDAHETPPPGWTGPVFKLRQDYPATEPPPETLPWASINPKTDSIKYVKTVLAYAFDGNTDTDWVVQNNAKRAWYHAPWMHSGDKGREFVHGMTRERNSRPRELAPTQTSQFQNWAVGVYNAPGGYVIGRVWQNHAAPDPSVALFPAGTVSIKLLFTAATDAEVPFMKNGFEWEANINQPMNSTMRSIGKMRLLQIDIAVREPRVDSTTGWVFGTFVYDGGAPGATPWERMVPVGAMWGNDPGVLPNTTKLAETVINPDLNVPQHLGWGGRLNGPVDNPASSCLSCHSLAEYEMRTPMVPPANATPQQRLNWFKNVKAGQPFDANERLLDYSLQLSAGINNCVDAGACTKPATTPSAPPPTAAAPLAGSRGGAASLAAPAPATRQVYKPSRD